MITVRMVTEKESDRIVLSISGIKGTEAETFAAMLGGFLSQSPNTSFYSDGNCNDLVPLKEVQQMPPVPDFNNVPDSASSVVSGNKTDPAVTEIKDDKPEDTDYPDFVKEANASINEESPKNMDPNEHILLNISYAEREKAKSVLKGLIRWDGHAKSWYCLAGHLDEVIERTKEWKTDIIKN